MYFNEQIPFTKRMGDTLVRAMQENKQYTHAMQFQKDMISSNVFDRKDHNQLVKEIADEVLARLTTTVDVSKAVKEIDSLEKIINSLGQ